jgi:hypothetical protein
MGKILLFYVGRFDRVPAMGSIVRLEQPNVFLFLTRLILGSSLRAMDSFG